MCVPRPLGNGVVSTGVEGMTPQDALHGEPPALRQTVLGYGLSSVLRAGWRIDAVWKEQGRDATLIEPNGPRSCTRERRLPLGFSHAPHQPSRATSQGTSPRARESCHGSCRSRRGLRRSRHTVANKRVLPLAGRACTYFCRRRLQAFLAQRRRPSAGCLRSLAPLECAVMRHCSASRARRPSQIRHAI